MRTIAVAGLVAMLALFAGLLAYSHHSENRKAEFATGAEARRAQMIGDDLFIPERLLPENATEIVTQFHMDTNERWLTFAFEELPAVRLPNCIADPALDLDEIHAPWWWSRAVAAIAEGGDKYRCIDVGETLGLWVLHDCVLVIGRSKGAWSCDSGRDVPKQSFQ